MTWWVLGDCMRWELKRASARIQFDEWGGLWAGQMYPQWPIPRRPFSKHTGSQYLASTAMWFRSCWCSSTWCATMPLTHTTPFLLWVSWRSMTSSWMGTPTTKTGIPFSRPMCLPSRRILCNIGQNHCSLSTLFFFSSCLRLVESQLWALLWSFGGYLRCWGCLWKFICIDVWKNRMPSFWWEVASLSR